MKIRNILLSIFLFLIPLTVEAASTVSIDVSSSQSTVIVGDTFYVYVEAESSNILGTYQYDISYNSKLLKLVSSPSGCESSFCTWVTSNGKSKTSTLEFKFKAIASGSSKITIENYRFVDYSENTLKATVYSQSIKTMTQAELEATYSKDNYLKSLSIDGATLSPSFNKSTLEYSVTLDSTVEQINIKATKNDSYATVSGTGKKKVSEGTNIFKVVVKAENGSKRTYTLNVTVKELNPITVTIDDKEYTVIKKSSLLKMPTNYTASTIEMEKEKIPVFIGDITGYTLIGLRDDLGNIKLYKYDQEKNSYSLYSEENFQNLTLEILDEELTSIPKGYTQKDIEYNERTIKAYKENDETSFMLVNALNLSTGKKDIYKIDIEENTAQRFKESDNTEEINELKDKYNKMLIGVTSLLVLVLLIVIISSLVTASKKKKRRKLKEEKRRQEEELKKKKNKEKKESKKDNETKSSH